MTRRALLVALVLVVTSCSGTGSGPSSAGGVAATVTPTSSPVEICTAQLRHWGTELLDAKDASGYDYQEMALTGTQYLAVLDIAERAKRLRARQGRAAAVAFVEREAGRACSAMAATPCTTNTGGAWPLLTRRAAGPIRALPSAMNGP